MKNVIYNIFYKAFSNLLGYSLLAIRIKWFIAIHLIGMDYHKKNIIKNRQKLVAALCKNTPLRDEIAQVIKEFDENDIYLLDAGCGPVSKTGHFIQNKNIIKEFLDPLADKYDELYKSYNINTNQNIRKGVLEKIRKYYSANYFHIIYLRNCLDHCFDPILALKNMIKVLKSGGYLILHHFVNEGKNANYYGLHQWNLNVTNNHFFIANKNCHLNYNVTKLLINYCHIQTYHAEEKLICLIKKI